jgi:hypothetical protein
LGAEHRKLYVDLRTSALLGTPSVQSVHGSYPFAIDDGGRLAPMAAELVDCMVALVAIRRLPGMDDVEYRSLRFDNYVRMQNFVRRQSFVPFRRFLGDVSAARILATSLCWSSWYFGFMSSRCFV